MEFITHTLYNLIGNWFIVAFLFALVVQLITLSLKSLEKKEYEKRKEILKEIKELKESSKDEKENKESINEAREIVKKHKGKPIFMVLPFLVFALLFTLTYFILTKVDSLPFYYFVPILTSILTLLSTITRKSWVFSLVISVICYFVYLKVNVLFGLFLMFYHAIGCIVKLFTFLKKKTDKNV